MLEMFCTAFHQTANVIGFCLGVSAALVCLALATGLLYLLAAKLFDLVTACMRWYWHWRGERPPGAWADVIYNDKPGGHHGKP